MFCANSMLAQNTDRFYLSGTDATHTVAWDFMCSDGRKAGKWHKIAVPSCWEQQGFGDYTYGRYYKKNIEPSRESGTYRRKFSVPASWRDKRIEIVFEGAMTDAEVMINKVSAGPKHQGGFTAFSYDITNLLKVGGKNEIEVKVDKMSSDKSVVAAERKADWWLFGGLYRPVYLRALPKTHISHVAIDAKAGGDIDCSLRGEGLKDGSRIRVEVEGAGTKETTLKSDSNGEYRFGTSFNNIKPWNPEHPHLYNVNISLLADDGTVAHTCRERIGFRTIEFRYRDGFYLNGKKLLIKGVNRHCFDPETGRATSKSNDIEDIRLIKAMNANAIRSHYPPGKQVLDICDSLGVLYLEELAGWQNAYTTKVGTKILKEMIDFDINHPCIIIWSNGNEGGFNYNLDPLFKKYDIQGRHVVHAWALFDGVDAHHYPAYQTGVGRLANGYQVFMPTEFLHAQYDKGGGASLDDFWNNYRRNPLFAGGFIWAWLDEGISRTDRNGAIDTDGPEAPDGIVGPHREREGSWYTIRDVWSPLQIAPARVRPDFNGRLLISNESLFSALDEYRMKWQLVKLPSAETAIDERVVKEADVILPNSQPGETASVLLDGIKEYIVDADMLRLTAFNSQGDTINEWTWMIEYADEYVAKYADGKQRNISEAARILGTTLEGGNVKAVFNEEGLLQKIVSANREIPFGNGPMAVGMKAKFKSMDTRMEGNDAILTVHYTGAIDSIVWRMKADGTLGMDALLFNSKNGHGYDGAFVDANIKNIGLTFDYPEKMAKAMRWLGKGPYRVWRNRIRGTQYGIHRKEYNNTITGESTEKLVYPEFKGYHANLYWATIESDEAPFTVYSATDGLYFRVFTPEEPHNRRKGEDCMEKFPSGDISFLLDIPAMRSYKPLEQLGPQAISPNVRINQGDEGLHVRLLFKF